jgi:hypothetical protein
VSVDKGPGDTEIIAILTTWLMSVCFRPCDHLCLVCRLAWVTVMSFLNVDLRCGLVLKHLASTKLTRYVQGPVMLQRGHNTTRSPADR